MSDYEYGTVRDHVLKAFELGETLDLDDCIYGPSTGGNRGYIDETMSYYRLLAGHCALTGAETVVEVGTHYGGSTLALLAGMRAGRVPNPLLVTLDITDLNRARLEREPEIRKVIGDSTRIGFMKTLVGDLPSEKVDLLYIDALKTPSYVLTTMHNAHAVGLEVKWLILDDVQTTPEMRRFWNLLEYEEPEAAFLVSREFPHIRRPEMGFGVIDITRTRDLMGRSRELMHELGLNTDDLQSLSGHLYFEAAQKAGADASYRRAVPGAPVAGSTTQELSTLFDLARDVYTGAGDIVDLGSFLGASTRALCEGLAQNEKLSAPPHARIMACDRFIHDIPALERHVEGRVALGESVLPIFFDNIADHAETVNVVPIEPNTVRWCGRPVEFLIAGALRTRQSFAHAVAEFVPWMLPDSSLLVALEITVPYRPWIPYIMGYLADHFEILSMHGGVGVMSYHKPVPRSKIERIVEDRFSFEERVKYALTLADRQPDPSIRWDLQAQGAVLAQKYGQHTLLTDILTELQDAGEPLKDARRQKRLKKLEEQMQPS